MKIQHYILATAGHVDHGKSSLVKALTGTDPDRLPEEKNRGITIDLGFAHLELPAPAGTRREPGAPLEPIHFRIGIIDVPGHEDFVKNMVAGVGSIDLALFIVAADDGWMPQTEEHLQILSYLGVKRAVMALTKIDLTGDPPSAIADVRESLKESPFSEAPIVPTSVVTGHGLQELKLAIASVLGSAAPPRDFGKPRLPIDRVFTLRGIGTVVTGTLSGGILKKGQAVVIQPAGRAARIRSIQSFNREVEASPPGSRTALNLPDIGSHTVAGEQGAARGDIVTLPEFGSAAAVLGVLVKRSERLKKLKSAAARPLQDGTRVKMHLGSGHVPARLLYLEAKALGPGERAIALLRCESPAFAFVGDRFVLRDWSEQWTLGGGVVLDPEVVPERARSEEERMLLTERAAAPDDVEVLIQTQLRRDQLVRRDTFLAKAHHSREGIQTAVRELAAKGIVAHAGEWVLDGGFWRDLKKKSVELIDREHQKNPQLAGVPLNELRSALEPLLPRPELFPLLMDELCRDGFRQAGVHIGRGTHRPELPPQLQTAGRRLREILAAKGFDPPSRKDLAPDSASQQALRFLIQTGEAVEIGEEIVLLTENAAKATQIVKQQLRQRGSATVSELRQAIGASRRIVVPLLERLDREGVTRREGDKRVLRG